MRRSPGCGGLWAAFSSGPVEAHPNLEYTKIKDCGGPWAAFSSGGVEAHPTLEYTKIKGDKIYAEAPWLWRPPGCGGPLVVEAPWLRRPPSCGGPCATAQLAQSYFRPCYSIFKYLNIVTARTKSDRTYIRYNDRPKRIKIHVFVTFWKST